MENWDWDWDLIFGIAGLVMTVVGVIISLKKSSNNNWDNSNHVNGGINININPSTGNKVTQTGATQEIKSEEKNNQETSTNKQDSPESPKRRHLFSSIFFIIGGLGLGASAKGYSSDTNLNGKASPDSSLPESASEPETNSNKVSWEMKSFITESNGIDSIMSKAPKRLSELVRGMSGGEFEIIAINEKNHITDSIVDEVDKGEYQCGIPGIYYKSNNKRYGLYFGVGIPFGLNPLEQTAWLHHKRARKSKIVMEEIYEKYDLNNIKLIPLIATGQQMGGWFKEPITTKKDFEELKIRIPGIAGEVLKKFKGTEVKQIISGKGIIDLIRRERINAFEWSGPHDDLALRKNLHATEIKEFKYYYYPGIWEPGTTFILHVNKNAWGALTPEYQKILEASCAQVYAETLSEYHYKNGVALKEFKKLEEKGEVKICKFDPELLETIENETTLFLENHYEKNKSSDCQKTGAYDCGFEFAYTEWKNFRDEIRFWSDKQYQRPPIQQE